MRVSVDLDDISKDKLRLTCRKGKKLCGKRPDRIYRTRRGFHLIWDSVKRFGRDITEEEMFELRKRLGDDSVSEDSMMYWKENDNLRYTNIAQLHDSFQKGNQIHVLSMQLKDKRCRNPNLRKVYTECFTKIEWSKVIDSFFKGKKDIYRIDTVSGNSIEVTKCHSLFSKKINNKNLRPLELDYILKNLDNERIACCSKEISEFNKNYDKEIQEVIFNNRLNEVQGRMNEIQRNILNIINNIGQYDEVKKLRNEGFSYRKIAKNLGINISTVHYHAMKDDKIISRKNLYKIYRREYGKTSKHILEMAMNHIEKRNHSFNSFGKSLSIVIKQTPIEMEHEEVKINDLKNFICFCGLWLADGFYEFAKNGYLSGEKPRAVTISTGGNPEVIEFLRNFCDSEKFNISHKGKGDYRIFSTQLGRKMLPLGFNGNSYTKSIPNFIFTLPNELIHSFLRGYFSGDGHITLDRGKPIIRCDSRSQEIASGIHILLLKCGINSNFYSSMVSKGFNSKDEKKYPLYHVKIERRQSFDRFIDKIGFIQQKSEQLIKRGYQKHMIEREISTKKIRKIEHIGMKNVYDIEVENNSHSFVANGVLCHNTNRIKLDLGGNRIRQVLFSHKTFRTYDCPENEDGDRTLRKIQSFKRIRIR